MAALSPGQRHLFNELRRRVRSAFEGGDLDALVASLVLGGGRSNLAVAPFAEEIGQCLKHPGLPPEPRPQDVAIEGCRLALLHGEPDASRRSLFEAAVRKELRRRPLPPAATLFEDERLWLGVAAGVGRAGPDVRVAFEEASREHIALGSVRDHALNSWRQVLAQGAARFSGDAARRGIAPLRERLVGQKPAATVSERIAASWFAARLLFDSIQLGDDDIGTLSSLVGEGLDGLGAEIADVEHLPYLDASLLLDAFCRAPMQPLARKAAVDVVLRIVDGFPAAASILANRREERPPFLISDEYDVQELFHAMSVSVLPDIVREDPAPKKAGTSVRLDFTAKAARLGVEVKCVRDKAHSGAVRREILLDEATYEKHPDVDVVIAFVYDPKRCMRPEEDLVFERDLSQDIKIGQRTVTYIVRVRR